MPEDAGLLISLKTSIDKLVSTEGKCKENRISLNARRRELLEKLIVAHLVTKLSPVWNPELLLPCLQDAVTRPYLEPVESTTHLHTLF
jgi:hypothetical protein